MPGVYKHAKTPTRSITSVPDNITAALVHTERGIEDYPVLCTSFPRVQEAFGWFDSDQYTMYELQGAFDNGLESIYLSRVCSDSAKSAMGGNNYKVPISKALFEHVSGAINSGVYFEAVTSGLTGLNLNAVVETAAVDNFTTVALANLYDVVVTLASTDAWKKTAKVVSYVTNGHSMLIPDTHAVPAAGNAVCFYANVAGVSGDLYSVTIVDSGGAGPVTYAFSGDGKTLTIDLDGLTPTATAVCTAVNALVGGIRAFEADDTGAATVTQTLVNTNLANGSNAVKALINATWEGTGAVECPVLARTYLVGPGTIAGASKVFTDTSVVNSLTPVTDSCIPGDILVIMSGANEGAYVVNSVPDNASVVVTKSTNFDAQTGVMWYILGTSGAYGNATVTLNSPGAGGDAFKLNLTKEYGGATLKAVLSVLDADNTERELESFTGLSPVTTSSDYIETRLNAEALWMSTDFNILRTLSTATDGVSGVGTATFNSATATFISDGVVEGNLLVLEDNADIGVYEVLSVGLETQITITGTFPNGSAVTTYVVRGDDTTGGELLALVGSSGLDFVFGGGVSAVPDKADYIGNSSTKTGVYALNKIPIQTLPSKFFVPEAPVVVDSTGVDATDDLNVAMDTYANAKEYLIYVTAEEFGHTPTSVMAAVSAQSRDSNFYATYWPWVEVNDPVTGRTKWIPVVGHMMGIWDRVGAGDEGIHKAPANEVIYGILDVEYNVDSTESDLLDELNINVIRDMGYYTAWGANLMSSDADYRPIHKRRVIIRTVMSIVRNLQRSLTFGVNAVSNWNKAKSKIDTYCSGFDRRRHSNGCFENKTDPSAQPWEVICGAENNTLDGDKLNIDHFFCIVDMLKEIHYYFGLSDGNFEIEQQ